MAYLGNPIKAYTVVPLAQAVGEARLQAPTSPSSSDQGKAYQAPQPIRSRPIKPQPVSPTGLQAVSTDRSKPQAAPSVPARLLAVGSSTDRKLDHPSPELASLNRLPRPATLIVTTSK